MLSYAMAYYRYPALLRKIESRMSAEELGDRARNMGTKINALSVGWAMPGFYLLGREWFLNLGLIRPQDAADDLVYLMDFWKRFELAYHRNDGHVTNRDFGHRSQPLPDRRVQVFHGDLFDCASGDDLHEAAQAFMAAASQYGFLISCESRISLLNSGPYRLDDGRFALHLQNRLDVLDEVELLVARRGPEVVPYDRLGFPSGFAFVADVGDVHPRVPHLIHRTITETNPLVRIGIMGVPMILAAAVNPPGHQAAWLRIDLYAETRIMGAKISP